MLYIFTLLSVIVQQKKGNHKIASYRLNIYLCERFCNYNLLCLIAELKIVFHCSGVIEMAVISLSHCWRVEKKYKDVISIVKRDFEKGKIGT